MPSLTDIPSEVILEHLLPILPLTDIASLSAVAHFFRNVSRDPAFWRLKATSDFSFSPALHPPAPSPDWWRRVYLGLLNPRAYVWGTSTNGRLGGAENGDGVRGNGPHVDEPAEIVWDRTSQQAAGGRDSLATDPSSTDNSRVPGVVELQASGWSFTARCSDGSVWVWGQMDGTGFAFRPYGWENRHAIVRSPTKVPLPCKAEAISTGRCHLLVLDSDNLIWELRSWGTAYHHTAPALTAPVNHGSNRHPPHIVQLSAGWQRSAALSSKGTIYVWYPFTPAYRESLTSEDDLNGPMKPTNGDNEDDDDDNERALKWGKVGPDVVYELPSIPERPELDQEDDKHFEYGSRDRGGHTSQELRALWSEYESTRSRPSEDDQKVVKLASGGEFLLALKKNGEVWHIGLKDDLPLRWRYLPYFSSPSITHITAQFQSITSYATPTSTSDTSALYHTRLDDDVPISENPDILLYRPDALPTLQNKQIIQVASGDYHYAALTSKGEMYTWGKGNNGQLGLGELGGKGEEVEPTKVSFDQDTDSEDDEDDDEGAFVFAITAAGWHTGALVLGDLDPAKRKAAKIETSDKQAAKAAEHGPNTDAWQTPDIIHLPLPRGRGGFHFRGRIGYAGRGLFRGVRGGHAPAAPTQGGGHEVEGQEGSGAGGSGGSSSVSSAPGWAEETAGEGARQEASTSTGGGTEGQDPPPQQPVNGSNHPLQQPSNRGLRALPHFRVGFAGRPVNLANRGGGANHNGAGFTPDGPE
ncbi:hypothetical protein IAR50_001306 [Cryptococcus sp. DSM 104548]